VARDEFDAALAGFRRWTKTTQRKLAGEPGADVGEMRVLLDLMRDRLGVEGPGGLRRGDVEELLLRIYPRTITVLDPADTEDTVPALRDFLAYLADRGELPQGGARVLERELDRVAPRFAEAVMDPANWGMARSIVQAMAADGVDLGDQSAVDRWIVGYNARVGIDDRHGVGPCDDEDVGVDLKEAFGLPDELPPMRLPAAAELAGMARRAPMVGRLTALAEWVGAGRAVTEDAELVPDEAERAAAALGVPRLEHLWRLALDAGFIELDDDETHAVRGETARAWPDSGDAEVLETWDALLGLVLGGTLDAAASLDPRRSRELDFAGHGAALAVMLFLARSDGVPVGEASEVIRDASVAELAPDRAEKAWRSWVRAHGDPARLLLDRLADLGAVRVSAREEGEVARLTPLGLASIRTQFAGSGIDIPLLPPPAEMTAADLLAMADGASDGEFQAETAGWLAHRTPECAARDLLSAGARSGPAARMLAVAVVTELGTAAGPAWQEALGQPELRGYAKATLAMLAGAEPPDLDLTEDDLAWMLTDGLVVDGWGDTGDDAGHEPAALAQRLSEAVPAGRELAAFEMMARVPHPDAAAVLTVIGRHHPDKNIAKAARKAAYKAASRRAAGR
jgi:hypothetical protein